MLGDHASLDLLIAVLLNESQVGGAPRQEPWPACGPAAFTSRRINPRKASLLACGRLVNVARRLSAQDIDEAGMLFGEQLPTESELDLTRLP